MRKFAIAAALSLVAIAMIAPASARTCGADVTPVSAGSETIYLVDTGEGYANGWVYLEQNGEEGLQRGGPGSLNDVAGIGHYDADCDGPNPDMVIY